MENMQNVTAALNALGVKTCLACAKTGAKSLCTGCRTVYFCGKACQKEAWPGHKRECRRVVRERTRVLDGIAADYAADEAIAAEDCQPHIPKGAECYICLNQAAPGQLRGDLVRMCSCRGPHAGFVHIRCLVKNAEVRGEYDDLEYQKALLTCTQCRQQFEGPVLVALNRATWLHVAGRAETDQPRQNALKNLAAALGNVDRLDEALVIHEESLATMRRLYGPDVVRTIEAEEGVAITLRRLGKPRDALQILTRTYAWRIKHYGRDDENTLDTAGHLADAQSKLGNFPEAIALFRTRWAGFRRTSGDTNLYTLESCVRLAQTLRANGEIDEARQIRSEWLPVVRRVMGPDHPLARMLGRQDFF